MGSENPDVHVLTPEERAEMERITLEIDAEMDRLLAHWEREERVARQWVLGKKAQR